MHRLLSDRRRHVLACAVAAALPLAAALPAHAATVTGRIIDADSRFGFEGATVRVLEANRSAVSGDDGGFRIAGLPAGRYTLQVQYVGAAPVQQAIQVGEPVAAIGDIALTGAAGGDATTLGSVLVIGQAAGQAAAINQQRSADTITNVISSDAIGQFPDQNVAESLQRVPGISLQRDQGEGRFVVIRGVSAALNSTTINGVRVAAPEADSRQVNLDVIASDLLETIVVTKSVTPDMDADTIGGNVEIRSVTAFDRGGRSYTLRAEGSYNELRDTTSPKLSGTYTDLFSVGGQDTLGVAASLSWFERDLASDGIEGAGWPMTEGPDGTELPALEEGEQRDYVLTRERLSAALNFDYRPADGHEYYLRTLFSRFGDDEIQLSNVYKFSDGDVSELTPTRGVFEGAEVERLDESREEVQEIFSTVLGGRNQAGGWTLDYSAAYSFANEDNPDVVNALYVGEDLTIGYDATDPERPDMFGVDPAFADAGNFALDEIVAESGFTEETEIAFTFNARRELQLGAHPGFVKFGGKARLRDKEADLDATVYEGFGGDYTLADFQLAGGADYPFGRFNPAGDTDALRAFVRANAGDFEINQDDTRIENAGGDYRLDEDITAAYLMGGIDVGDVRLIGGARFESTDYRATGAQVRIDEESGDGEPVIVPISADKTYDDLLPSLHLRWDMGERAVLRASLSHSLARPGFESASPRQVIEIEEDDGEFERNAEVGNPDLEPLRSRNLDLQLEYYPGNIGVLSAGVFRKDIENFFVTADVAGTDPWGGFDEVITTINGDDAELWGIELAWTQKLSRLPAPFDGLLVSANYTHVDSEARLPTRSEPIPLPGQSDNVANLSLGYEKHGLSLRLAGTWRDGYFDEANDLEDAAFDRYVNDHLQVDFLGSWFATPSTQLYLNLINLTDEPFRAYFARPRYLSQFEQYGMTVEAGVRFSY